MIYNLEDILLRPFVPEDITNEYRTWFHDSEVTRYNTHGLFPYARTEGDFIRLVKSSDDMIVWAIIHKEHGHIGNVALQRINWIFGSAEVAIIIGNKMCWGKGYATAACAKALDHAFLRLGLNRVWTGTAATNKGMQRVCAKLGMQEEGRCREGMFLDGKPVDVLIYGLLANDYFCTRGDSDAEEHF